jgi:hypothetical protein
MSLISFLESVVDVFFTEDDYNYEGDGAPILIMIGKNKPIANPD